MKKLLFFYCFVLLLMAKDSDYRAMIEQREKFFRESLAQTYDSVKIQVDSKSKLPFIDFCAYPPDRSLPYGALENGRFHGNKIKDLPFTCNLTSGAKKFFIKDSTIAQAYHIIRYFYNLSFLQENIPQQTLSNQDTHYIWQTHDAKTQNYIVSHTAIQQGRLWVLYTSNSQRYTLIFQTKGSNTEVVMQYIRT